MARNISEDCQRTADHHRRHDRQAIQAIGQIYCVTGTNDNQAGQQNEGECRERKYQMLEEGHDQFSMRRQAGVLPQVRRHDHRNNGLPQHLGFGR